MLKYLTVQLETCLEEPVFEKRNANSKDEKSSVTKKYSQAKHSSNKLTPNQASKNSNNGYV